MSTDASSKEMERRAALYHDDGIMDMAIGLAMLIFGVIMILDQAALTGVYIAVLIPAVQALKRSITVPRMEQLALAPAPDSGRKATRMALMVALGLVVFLVLGLLVFFRSTMVPPWLTGWLSDNGLVVLDLLVAGLLVLAGWVTGARRLYGYAGLTILLFAAGQWLGIEPPIYVMALGAIILVCGVLVLIEFVRRYPQAGQPGA